MLTLGKKKKNFFLLSLNRIFVTIFARRMYFKKE